MSRSPYSAWFGQCGMRCPVHSRLGADCGSPNATDPGECAYRISPAIVCCHSGNGYWHLDAIAADTARSVSTRRSDVGSTRRRTRPTIDSVRTRARRRLEGCGHASSRRRTDRSVYRSGAVDHWCRFVSGVARLSGRIFGLLRGRTLGSSSVSSADADRGRRQSQPPLPCAQCRPFGRSRDALGRPMAHAR